MTPSLSTEVETVDEIWDVSVTVEARIDEPLMELATIAHIQPGTVIASKRPAGDVLEVYVGNVLFAAAEVVVIEDTLALRITKLECLKA